MSDIEKVKQLRQSTGAGFKDCNNALNESNCEVRDKILLMHHFIVGFNQNKVPSPNCFFPQRLIETNHPLIASFHVACCIKMASKRIGIVQGLRPRESRGSMRSCSRLGILAQKYQTENMSKNNLCNNCSPNRSLDVLFLWHLACP